MRYSFTLLEFIVVVVTVGILAGTMIPNLSTDPLLDATLQVVRHFKYTQQLAMSDDRYDAEKPLWFKSMWRISFRSNNCYLISSNIDFNHNYDRTESAHDPLTQEYLYSNTNCEKERGDNSFMYLESYFGVSDIQLNSSCGNNMMLAFDEQGRPHASLSKVDDLLKNICKISLYHQTRKSVITVQPQTGYVDFTIEDQ